MLNSSWIDGGFQMKNGLESQEKVYQFLRGYIAEHGYAPSVRDICMGTGIASTSTVYLHLRNLAKEL
jgi:repressor LexA